MNITLTARRHRHYKVRHRMFAPRSIAAILAGCFVLSGVVGCQTSPGRRVVWLREKPATVRIDEEPSAAPVETTEYKAVEEYSLANVPSDGDPSTGRTDAGLNQAVGTAPPKARGLFGKRSSQGTFSSVNEDSQHRSLSEPVESQQRLVPQPDRKRGFWERIGNGFRDLTDLARGHRRVNALAVLPFQPDAKKPTRKAELAAREKPMPIPAFTLQAPESISQTTALDKALEAPNSDLVSHWNEYPSSGSDELTKVRNDADFPPLQSPQAATAP